MQALNKFLGFHLQFEEEVGFTGRYVNFIITFYCMILE